jgi:ATP phosphoribosyltransferase
MAAESVGLRIALPKGRFQEAAASLVAPLELGFASEDSRNYRFTSQRLPGLSAKLVHEKDIPVQVALGHYALGICGREWVEELRSKYASGDLVVLQDLPVGRSALVVAQSRYGESSWEGLRANHEAEGIRIASEFPNLAEAFALRERLRRFRVFPLWGAAEAYPPEAADLVLLAVSDESALAPAGLVPVAELLQVSACIVAHQPSLARRDLAPLLAPLLAHLAASETANSLLAFSPNGEEHLAEMAPNGYLAPSDIRIALPDGSLQGVVMSILDRAGLSPEGYASPLTTRRPVWPEVGVRVKVIRPQDMALQVANGHFDLAITGYDWLEEHKAQFPQSPVATLADLGNFGRGSGGQQPLRLVSVVHGDLPVTTVEELRDSFRSWRRPLRLASEYVHLADSYARRHHLAPYRVIPSWGATEGFLPEDADVLIENTETGSTIARLGLRIIDQLFLSPGRLIAYAPSLEDPRKGERMRQLAQRLVAAREAL